MAVAAVCADLERRPLGSGPAVPPNLARVVRAEVRGHAAPERRVVAEHGRALAQHIDARPVPPGWRTASSEPSPRAQVTRVRSLALSGSTAVERSGSPSRSLAGSSRNSSPDEQQRVAGLEVVRDAREPGLAVAARRAAALRRARAAARSTRRAPLERLDRLEGLRLLAGAGDALHPSPASSVKLGRHAGDECPGSGVSGGGRRRRRLERERELGLGGDARAQAVADELPSSCSEMRSRAVRRYDSLARRSL